MSEGRDDGIGVRWPNFEQQADAIVARAKDRAKLREEEEKTFWRAVLANVIGRRVMWNLLMEGHAFEMRFSAEGSTEKTWVLAGEQRLAFKLYRRWQEIDIDAVRQMHVENDRALFPAPDDKL